MMANSASHDIGGTVDPEILYSRQNCIGGGSFGKVYKGFAQPSYATEESTILRGCLGSIGEQDKL